MSFLNIGLLLGIGLFFLISVRSLLAPFLRKTRPELSVIAFSWILGGVFLLTLFVGVGLFHFVGDLTIPQPWVLSLIPAGVAFVMMPWLFKHHLLLQSALIFGLCLVGTLFIPPAETLAANRALTISVQIIVAFCWMLFILLNTLLDRIPLFTYVSATALFAALAFGSTTLLPLFSTELCAFFLLVLMLNMASFFVFQKLSLLSYQFPIVFLLSWLEGFALAIIALNGNAAFVPIIIAYNLTEIIGAVLLNAFLYHRLFPISVPFAAERAFLNHATAKTFTKRVFYHLLLLALIGIIGCVMIYRDVPNTTLMSYGLAAMILLSLYNRLLQKQQNISFRSLIRDLKAGVISLTKEAFTVPLKSDKLKKQKNTPADKTSQKGKKERKTK